MKKLFIPFLLALLLVASGVYAQTTVRMNEIYSRGGGTVHPDPDWIELYNPANTSVDISGYKIYDSGGQGGTKAKKEIPANTTIPAKGFYVVTTDGSGASDFGLSSSGEQVWLENNSGTVIDNVTFPTMSETQTYGREYYGTTWALQNTMTKNLSNSIIVMNEIYSRGGGTVHPDPDWIELYNASTAAVDISGYKIYDSGGNGGTKPKMTIPNGTSIAAKGFYVVVTDISTSVNPAGFGLSSSGEEVWLENSTGVVIDNYTFGAMAETQTFSRVPNGGTFYLVNALTKGTDNQSTVGIEKETEIPSGYALLQNYPNPFNPTTTITYQLPKEGFVELKVFDAVGREVALLVSEVKPAGSHQVNFNAGRLASGVYLYSLKTASFSQVKKLMLLK